MVSGASSSCRTENSRLQKADQLLAEGNLDQAVDQYLEQLEFGPHAAASRGLGLAYEASGNPQQAESSFQATLDGLEHDVVARLGHARVSAVLGDLQAARRDLEEVLSRHPDNRPALYLLNLYSRAASDLRVAVEKLQKTLENADGHSSATAFRILADSWDRLGNPRSAQRARRSATLAASESHEVDLQLAQAALATGRNRLAVALLTPLVELSRSNEVYGGLLVTAYLASEQWAEAEAVLSSDAQVLTSERQWLTARARAGLGYGNSSIAQMQKILGNALAGGDTPDWRARRHWELSTALRSAGRYDEAHKVAQSIPNEPPWQLRRELELARIELTRLQFNEAVERLSAVQAVHQEEGQLFEVLGQALAASGKLSGAENAFRQEALLVADRPEPILRLATVLLHLARPTEAVDVLRANITQFPGHWPSIALWMRALRLSSDSEVAAELIEQATSKEPTNALLWVAQGQQFFEKRSYAKALTAFRHASTLAPDHSRVLTGLALSYAELDRHDLALATLKNTEPASSSSLEWILQCARLYRSLGNEGASEQLLSQALIRYPKHPWLQAALASSWSTHREKVEVARQLLAEAVTELPADPLVRSAQAWVKSGLNEMEQARQHMDAALQTSPNDPELQYLDALLLLRNGQPARAREQFASALNLDPLLAHGAQVRSYLRSPALRTASSP